MTYEESLEIDRLLAKQYPKRSYRKEFRELKNKITEKISSLYFNDKKCEDESEEEEVNNFLGNIKKFGNIREKEIKYKFKFNGGQNYIINNNDLSVTKSKSGWDGLVFGDKEIPKNKITKWKIKLNSDLNYRFDDLYIGIGKNISTRYNDIWRIFNHCSNIQINLEGSTSLYNNHKEKFKKGDRYN